ncbi:uncharacterized protein [Antedon mediterranea]|uniref:uncharacterized protein n=1 Tax=Antedon mediterranea TaxID=105859 RepID=UPI003AF8F9AF
MKKYTVLFVYSILFAATKDRCVCSTATNNDVLTDRQHLDSNGWTMVFSGGPFTCPGYVKAWKWYPSVSTSFLGLVWRPTSGSNEFEVIGRTLLPAVSSTNEIHTHELPISEWIPVEVGDMIGFKFDQSLIRYDSNHSSQVEYVNSISIEDLVVGSSHTIGGTGFRTYSIIAIHEDYFDNRFVITTKCKRLSTMKKVEPGWKLPGHVIRSVQRPSAIACVTSCQKEELCWSITYDKENGNCHLNNVIKGQTLNYQVTADDIVYYEFNYEATVQDYEECDICSVYNGVTCESTRVCRCAGDDSSNYVWNLIFKGVAETGVSVRSAYVDGTGASQTDTAASLLSSQNFRLNEKFEQWASLQVQQVKVTLYSASAEELISLVFNGVNSDTTSWYSVSNLIDSPWTDLTTSAAINYFGINGHSNSRTWYINSHYGGCSVDTGWLVAIDKTLGCVWEAQRGSTYPVFLYSLTSNLENWTTGSIGKAHVLTVRILYNRCL